MSYKNERSLTDAIVRALDRDARDRDRRQWVLKVHGGPYQMTGIPDLLVVAEGRLVGLEVKHQKPGESRDHAHARVTMRQRKALVDLRDAGAWADVVVSPDEAVKAVQEAATGAPAPSGGWLYDAEKALVRAAS